MSTQEEKEFRVANKRRAELIKKRWHSAAGLSSQETTELDALQALAEKHVESLPQIDPDRLEELRRRHAEITPNP